MNGDARPKVSPEQRAFLHNYNLSLERFAESLFGEKYYKSVDRTDMAFWKGFYLSALEVISASIFRSIGTIDRPHKNDLQQTLDRLIQSVRDASSKDEIHSRLIVGLFKLVFLLLGRAPYYSKGKIRNLSTFRTLTYSQTEEQLSWLLQGYVQSHPSEHGFIDSFEADYAHHQWAKQNKRSANDRPVYVDWVRLNFPDTYSKFR